MTAASPAPGTPGLPATPGTPNSRVGTVTPRSAIGPNSCTSATLRAMKYYTVGAKLVKMGVPQTPRSGILNLSLRTASAPSSDLSSTIPRLTPASPERPRTSATPPTGVRGGGTPLASPPHPPRTAPPRAFTEPNFRGSTADSLWRTFGVPLHYLELAEDGAMPPPTRDGALSSIADKVVEELGDPVDLEMEQWEEEDDALALRAKVDALRARCETERAEHQRTHDALLHIEAESIVLLRENIELASRFHQAHDEAERGAAVALTAAGELQQLRETADRLTRRMKEVERVRWETDALSMDRQLRITNLERRNAQLDALLRKEERSRERQRATLLSQYRRLRLLAKERAKLRADLEREAQRRRRAETSARATIERLAPLQEKNLILAYKLMNREHELERTAADLRRADAHLADLRSKNALLSKAYEGEKTARLRAQDEAGYTEVRLADLGDRAGDMAERLERELADRRRLEEIEAGLQEEVRALIAARAALAAALAERDAALVQAGEALAAERAERALAEARCEELTAALRAEESGRRAEAGERAALRRELEGLIARLTRVMIKYKRCALCALGLHDHDHDSGGEEQPSPRSAFAEAGDPRRRPAPPSFLVSSASGPFAGSAVGLSPPESPRAPLAVSASQRSWGSHLAPPAPSPRASRLREASEGEASRRSLAAGGGLAGQASRSSMLSDEMAAAHADIVGELSAARRSAENARARDAGQAALLQAAGSPRGMHPAGPHAASARSVRTTRSRHRDPYADDSPR